VAHTIVLLIIKSFVYGFALFAGIVLVSDFPYYLGSNTHSIWGANFFLYGCVGGVMFIFSGLSLYILKYMLLIEGHDEQ